MQHKLHNYLLEMALVACCGSEFHNPGGTKKGKMKNLFLK